MTEQPVTAHGEVHRRDRSLASGLAWTAGAKWATQVLSWASTLIVARLLTPADYGIIGMAGVYLGFVQMVSEFGLGTALIQNRDLDRTQIARINGLSVLIGVALFALSCALALPIALFFHEHAVRLVVLVLASTYVITSLQVVPRALLARELRFRGLAAIESAEALIQTVATLAFAIAGARYWAIVFGSIVAKVGSTAMLLIVRPHRVAWPRQLSQLHRVLTFGWQVVVSRLAWYAYSNADFAVVGRLLGEKALGAYSFGWNIASIPADKLNTVLGRVIVPILAEVQGDAAAVARYLLRLSEGLAVLVLPASVGMALVAPQFVQFALGERWMAAVVPLQLLSVHVTVRCINSVFAQALLAIGDTRQSMRVGLWQLAAMPALFVVGAKLWGVPGVALMWLIGHPLVTFPPLILYSSRRIRMPLRLLAEALWPASAGTAVMAAAVLACDAFLPQDTATGVRLAVSVAVGAAVYPALMWCLFHRRIRSVTAALRRLRH